MECSLSPADLTTRLDEWEAVLAAAKTRAGGCATWERTPGLVEHLASLCDAEMACCPTMRFHLDIDAATVVLHVDPAAHSTA